MKSLRRQCARALCCAVIIATMMPAAASAPPPLEETAQENARQLRISGNLDKARAFVEDRLARAQKETGQVSARTSWWLNELGLVFQAQNRPQAAKRQFQRSLTIREALLGLHHPETISVVSKLGLLNIDVGNYAAAEPLLKRVLTASQNTASAHTATALANLASLYVTQQRFREAEPLLLRTLAIDEKLQGPRHPLTAITLNNLGELFRLQGRFQEAEQAYQRAITIDERASGPDSPDYAADLANLAALYLDTDRVAKSRSLLTKALEIAERKLGSYDPLVSAILGDLAKLFVTEARMSDAERLYLRALSINEKIYGRQHPDTAVTLTNLANLYASTGRLAPAEALLRRVLVIYARHLGAQSAAIGQTLINLAVVLQRGNRIGAAIRVSRQALAITRKSLGPQNIHTAYALRALGDLYFLERRYTKSQTLTREALDIFESTLPPNALQTALVNYSLSRCSLKIGRLKRALQYARQASAIFRARSTKATKDESEAFLQVVRTAFALAGPQAKPDLLANAFEAADLYITSATSDAVRHMALRFALGTSPLSTLLREQRHLIQLQNLADRQFAFALGSNDTATRAQAPFFRARLETTGSRLQAISARLQREHKPFIEYLESKPVTLFELQTLLKANEALVLTIPAPDGTYVFAVSREQSAWHRTSLSDAQISKHVSVLRVQLDPNQWQDSFSPFDRKRSHLLYRSLWQPIAHVLADKSTVFIVQSGSLASLPPSALITAPPKGGAAADGDPVHLRDTPWLAKRHAFVSVPSLSSFKALRSLSASPSGSEPFAGFGDPVTAPRILPALPFAARELRSLAKSTGASESGDVYIGSKATETQLKTLDLSRKRVIAFATHALTANEYGAHEPGLVFSSPQRPSQTDDGDLSASEAARLNLRADWIILSACNTAAGASPGAEGLSGLARAFFYAGARSILVSNWPVWDDTAERLTTATVAQFQKYPRQGRAAALHKAMLSLMQDTANPRFAHPATWASFALVGESQAR